MFQFSNSFTLINSLRLSGFSTLLEVNSIKKKINILYGLKTNSFSNPVSGAINAIPTKAKVLYSLFPQNLMFCVSSFAALAFVSLKQIRLTARHTLRDRLSSSDKRMAV